MSADISIIVPVYNEDQVLLQTYRRLKAAIAGLNAEILFVDDGSSDQSSTILQELAEHDSMTRVLVLSRNFGHQLAVTAGLQFSEGKAAIIIDADLQDPPELIPEFVQQWRAGFDVVYGIRESRAGESWFKKATARCFYRLLRGMSDVEIPLDVGDFRLLSRRVIDVLNSMPEHHRFIRGMAAWAGFKQIGIPYARAPRAAGSTKYPLRRMWRLSVDAVTGFTVAPLRVGTRLAALIATIAMLASAWLIDQKLTHPRLLVLGWTSLMVTILWLGALQLFVIGVVGEYVARIVEQTRGRPLFVISKVLNAGTSEAPQTRLSKVSSTHDIEKADLY